MTTMLAPTDTLDAVPLVGVVNGPEDEIFDWSQVDWDAAEDNVRRLRQRIFTASQTGDLATVRNLQKLMLRSYSNTLVSVRRVAQLNTGRKTAGIDGKTALLPQQKAELVDWVQHRSSSWTARAVRRVFIPKADGRQRPLGIPVLADRALQARVVNALEPSGRRGSSRDPTDFGPAAAAMTQSRQFCRDQRSTRETSLDFRRGFGGGVRPHRS